MGKKIDYIIAVLNQLMHPQFFEKSDGNENQLIVEEKKNDGKAEVICYMKNHSFQFHLEKVPIKPLRNQKCADGAIFEILNDNECLLHIIECKKKVTEKKWKDI